MVKQKTDYFWSIILNSKKANLTQADRDEEFSNNNFQNFLNNNNIKHYSRKNSIGAVLAKQFDRTSRDLLTNLFPNQEMVVGLIYYPE